MKNLLLICIIYFSLFFMLMSCKTYEDVYPEPTKNGSYHVVFKINGNIWEDGNDSPPDIFGGGSNVPATHYGFETGSKVMVFILYAGLIIHSNDKRTTKEYFQLKVRNVRGIGNYYLNIKTKDGYAMFDSDYFSGTTDSTNTGIVTISLLDTTRRIIAGTFSFQAKDTIRNYVQQFTDGWFDTKY